MPPKKSFLPGTKRERETWESQRARLKNNSNKIGGFQELFRSHVKSKLGPDIETGDLFFFPTQNTPLKEKLG